MPVKKSKVKVKRYGTTNIKDFFKDVVEPTALVVNRRIVKDVAEIAASEIRRRIKRQLFPHPRLTKKYREWKKKKDYDLRILIRTGTYIDNIGVQEVKYPRGVGYRVGLPEGVRDVDSKGKPSILLTELFKYLEYGTETMPPRAHFLPVYKEVVRKIATIKKTMSRGIEKELKKRIKRVRKPKRRYKRKRL